MDISDQHQPFHPQRELNAKPALAETVGDNLPYDAFW
jgi:hypothetical protein